MDDTTASKSIPKGGASNAQCIADQVIQWLYDNRVHLNADKCEKLRTSFAKKETDFHPVIVSKKELEVMDSAKFSSYKFTS